MYVYDIMGENFWRLHVRAPSPFGIDVKWGELQRAYS